MVAILDRRALQALPGPVSGLRSPDGGPGLCGRSWTASHKVSGAPGLRAVQGHDPQGGRNSSGASPGNGSGDRQGEDGEGSVGAAAERDHRPGVRRDRGREGADLLDHGQRPGRPPRPGAPEHRRGAQGEEPEAVLGVVREGSVPSDHSWGHGHVEAVPEEPSGALSQGPGRLRQVPRDPAPPRSRQRGEKAGVQAAGRGHERDSGRQEVRAPVSTIQSDEAGPKSLGGAPSCEPAAPQGACSQGVFRPSLGVPVSDLGRPVLPEMGRRPQMEPDGTP